MGSLAYQHELLSSIRLVYAYCLLFTIVVCLLSQESLDRTAKSESNLTSLSITHTAASSLFQECSTHKEEVEEGRGTSPAQAQVGGASEEKEEEGGEKSKADQYTSKKRCVHLMM